MKQVVILLLGMLFVAPVLAGEGLDSRLRAANHPATLPTQLERLAQDPDWRVRKTVASNQRAPGHVLLGLASDQDARVRAALAHNLRAPVKATISLVNDPAEDVRYSLAHCGYTDPAVLRKLSQDPSVRVRLQLVLNPNLPLDVLKRMEAEDKDRQVVLRASKMLEKRRDQ